MANDNNVALKTGKQTQTNGEVKSVVMHQQPVEHIVIQGSCLFNAVVIIARKSIQ